MLSMGLLDILPPRRTKERFSEAHYTAVISRVTSSYSSAMLTTDYGNHLVILFYPLL